MQVTEYSWMGLQQLVDMILSQPQMYSPVVVELAQRLMMTADYLGG